MRNYRPIIIEKIGITLPGIEILKLRLNEHLPEIRSSFHSHEHGQILIYLRGCGEQTVQGKRYPARAGTVIYVGPNERHRFERERSRQPLCLVIDVNLLSKNNDRSIMTLGELPATELNLIRSRVSQLFGMSGTGSEDRIVAVGAVILDILDPVLRSIGWLETKVIKRQRSGTINVRVGKIINDKIADASLSLSIISKMLGFQRDYLNRLLKKESGLTFSQIRSQIRLKKAQKMLMKGSSVGDVCVAVGMNDQNYFARWFRSQVGTTPTKWRLQNVTAIGPDRD
ncbi:AraC family transcriptional regulator [Verrucomicrobia bacterium]|nr:AraC family transcriptional regulator [Verrucomicrobiota bacterium]RZO14548.1 MAG: AraC family transcriptional regulator [Verrucomicrobiaceae bacterium]